MSCSLYVTKMLLDYYQEMLDKRKGKKRKQEVSTCVVVRTTFFRDNPTVMVAKLQVKVSNPKEACHLLSSTIKNPNVGIKYLFVKFSVLVVTTMKVMDLLAS